MTVPLPSIRPALLEQALTHRSWRNEHTTQGPSGDNERLEYLGDAVIDLVAAEVLYRRFPEMSAGEITALRSALVRTESLAQYARDLGLPSRIRMSVGEERAGGRRRDALLEDAFEALVGALYLDQGWLSARNFVQAILKPAAEQAHREKRDLDAKSVLQEYAQAQPGRRTPVYQIIARNGPDHASTFVVAVTVKGDEWGRGTGRSRREAEQNAARSALVQRVSLERAEKNVPDSPTN
jgi:ribonuclease-3